MLGGTSHTRDEPGHARRVIARLAQAFLGGLEQKPVEA
jgi:hypothetical protein